MNKTQITNILRDLRLMYLADKVRFQLERRNHKKDNDNFKREYPNFNLPPDYLIYESFQMNYRQYFEHGKSTAKWLKDYWAKHIELIDKKILDWGCGPGRVVRHLPEIVGNGCQYFGTDYNEKTIKWNSENLDGILFNHNPLEAKLPYEDNFMDVIYGISIFTHLSERLHYDWYNELYRVLRPGGIMFLTTSGDNFKTKMTKSELEQYSKDELVVRGKVKEGHRVYTTIHPPAFMKKLFSNATILEHVEEKPHDGWIPQDIWIVQKQ